MRRIFYAITLFGLLSMLDWAITMQAVESGMFHEANPFMVQVLALGGWDLVLAGKITSIIFITSMVYVLYHLGGWVPEWAAQEVTPVARGAAWLGVGLLLFGQGLVLVLNLALIA